MYKQRFCLFKFLIKYENKFKLTLSFTLIPIF